MRRGEVAWGLLLCGLPFAHFLFLPKLDLWHAQALWANIFSAILLGIWLIDKPTTSVSNRPLAAWLIWTTGLFLFQWHKVIANLKQYPLQLLQGYTHLLLIVLLIGIGGSLLDINSINKVGRWVAIAGQIMLVYCLIQAANLDQFFLDLDPSIGRKVHIVGSIGNPSHLASYLAVLLPFIYFYSGRIWLWLCIGLLVMTNSAVGIISAASGLFLCLFFTNRRLSIIMLIGILAAIPLILHSRPDLFNPHGRLEAWQAFWPYFVKNPITGAGSGFIIALSQTIKQGSPIFTWRHVHNEYFQIAIEQGLIGLGIILWGVSDMIRRFHHAAKSNQVILCGAVLSAFLLNSTLNFCAHLWMIGSLALFAYCGLLLLTEDNHGLTHI